MQEQLEDSKGVIKYRNSKKNIRQWSNEKGQKDKRWWPKHYRD